MVYIIKSSPHPTILILSLLLSSIYAFVFQVVSLPKAFLLKFSVHFCSVPKEVRGLFITF